MIVDRDFPQNVESDSPVWLTVYGLQAPEYSTLALKFLKKKR